MATLRGAGCFSTVIHRLLVLAWLSFSLSLIDWLVLGVTLAAVALYGSWKSRKAKGIDEYLVAGRSLPWYQVGLSVMATQASAITFISAPGQAYTNGMGFIQFYLGLPLAVIVLCVSFVPNFTRLKVFTAYEFLEQRFGPHTRMLTVVLFLFLRAISTAVSLYAPSLILAYLLKLPLIPVTVLTGMVVIVYTVLGGTRAVSRSQMLQMFVIFGAMGLAAWQTIHLLPASVGFSGAMHIAAAMGKLKALDLSFNLHSPYTLWAGLVGGFFLQLSYFGTDQSQVGRYLTAGSVRESRLGLVFNGLLKLPMQFMILLTGVLVFAFFQFQEPPAWFRDDALQRLDQGSSKKAFITLGAARHRLFLEKRAHVLAYGPALESGDASRSGQLSAALARDNRASDKNSEALRQLLAKQNPGSSPNDSNYIFLSFVLHYLPRGTVGLVIAMVFLASMGAVASAYNAMASCTLVDIYRRWLKPGETDLHYLGASRLFTAGWGLVCIFFALFVGRFGNLLEAVNRLGSVFYGTILGIFLCAFYLKQVGGKAVFTAAILAEILVMVLYRAELVEYLWLNAAGALLVIVLSLCLQRLIFKTKQLNEPL